MTVYSLKVLLSQFWTTPLSHVHFYLLLLNLHSGLSGKAGKLFWFSHHFRNFPEFVVIHTVKDFSVVKEAEVDVFLEFSCFFCDPVDVGNLISGSSAFSKSTLYIGKFLVHILLKHSFKDIEYYLASMWNECSWAVVSTFLWHCLSLGLEWKLTFSSPVSGIQLVGWNRLEGWVTKMY